MDDMIRVFIAIASLVGVGVGAYAGVAVVQVILKRLGSRQDPTPDELASLQARVAEVESLESRLEDLEQRVDFAERLIAQHGHEQGHLPAGRSAGPG